MSILVINSGSSTVKFGLFDDEARETLASGMVDWTLDPQNASLVLKTPYSSENTLSIAVPDRHSALVLALKSMAERRLIADDWVSSLSCVGHRVVHGGSLFRESVRITEEVKTAIWQLAEIAPLHNPPALEVIEASEALLPDVPQVAAFDTAFHSRMPASAFVYPLPYEWYADWGIRRFGFHGISYAYCAGRASEMIGRPVQALRMIICHLGNGSSASAIRGGESIANTMGFTPMDGLMMGTRPGSIDPGVLPYVQTTHRLSAAVLEDILNHRSGLLGISGVSSDYRTVEEKAQAGDDRARLALDMYALRVKAAIGALAVQLGRVDALVFTAGIGENSAALRSAACDGLQCLGLHLDDRLNGTQQPDSDVAAGDSAGRILIIHTREELMIAREARRLLGIV